MQTTKETYPSLASESRLLQTGGLLGRWLYRVAVAFGFVSFIILGAAESVQARQLSGVTQNDADDVKRNWRQDRIQLEHQFGEELVEIADWCRQNGIPQQVEPTFQLKIKRDPNRQYIFPPTTKPMPKPEPAVQGGDSKSMARQG